METVAGPRPIEPGTKLDDKYRIEQLLAVGGMGAVYLGVHTRLRKRVAIKVLNPQTSSKAMVERFHREAITASQIGHEGIAQVTDVGTSYEGEPFLVMEYLEGESLASRLSTSGRLPIEVACELGCAILAPLAAAHEAGVVHRDLKPDNVYLVRQSRGEMVKLLDFGISRAPGLEGEFRLTKTGLVLGTPYYMSPEQARGESEVGTAADLYAFGVILYEMLVGRVPIEGENYNQLMYRVMMAEYVPPRQLRPEIPAELEQIILQTMALEPAKRPPSASELERQLLAFCRPTFRDHQIERISSSSGISLHALSGVTAPMKAPVPAIVTSPVAVPAVRDSQDLLSEDLGLPRDTALTPVVDPSEIDLEPAEAEVATPTPRRLRWIIGAGIVLCSGLVGALVLANRSDEPPGERPAAAQSSQDSPAAQSAATEPSTAATVAPPAPPPATGPRSEEPRPPAVGSGAPPAAAPDAPKITLRFKVEPATAVIELDGARVTSREIKVRKDDKMHRLRITAPGYVTHEDEVRFDETQRLTVLLKRPSRVSPRSGGSADPKSGRIDSQSPYD